MAAAAVTLAILASTYGLIYVYFSHVSKHKPEAENGVLDLTAWQFADDGVVPIDGKWEFYPGRLLYPEDFASVPADGSAPQPVWIDVPGSWAKHMETLGTATYRLRIRIGDGTSVYGLKTSSIQMSSRIFVGGEEVGRSGFPEAGQSYRSQNKPVVSFFTLEPGWNEIILQVSNYDFPPSSGVIESIYLGHAGQISALRDRALSHDWISVTAFLIMGLYFVGLYTQRKNDLSLFMLGMVFVFFALYTSTRGERVLFEAFGFVPFWLFIRIQLMSAVGAGLTLLLYVYTAFRSFCSKWLVRSGVAVGALFSVGILLFFNWFEAEVFRQMVTLYATLPLLYAIYVFVVASFNKVEGSLYLAGAAIALNVYALVQNSNVYFGVPVDSLPPFEPFVLLLMLALLMSLRFSNAFKQIEKLSVQLMKADKLKDEFLARTSHEFKSPLHGVLHISRSLLEDTRHPLHEEQREKVHLITSISGRLSQLVYDILDFSKLKQGELTIDPKPVDVRSAVEMQVRIYSFLGEDRQTRLLNRVPEHLPYAMADESRFSQIIGNLLDNAVKHTRGGSIVVSADAKEGMIEISVSDTGEGIEAHHLPYIFEAFQTFDDTKDNRGFGLGLPIVKQLVELQRGRITVFSTRGVGTTFTFTLPIASSGEISGKAFTTTSAAAQQVIPAKTTEYTIETPYYLNQKGSHTILIVDDQFLNLKVLMDALQPLGHNVIAVKNGYEALEEINKPNKIDLVVLDLMMPGMSGYEVCQEIRKTYTLPELPVLMVTAAIGSQDKVAAFEVGANDFLPKPFDLAELKARISGLLALKDSLAKAVDLEVAFLQSQIKPHFLYNVLNSIVATSYTDVERSRKLTSDLADYLRGSFRFSHTEKRVSFEEEFSLILTYVEIEKARFKDRLQFEYDIAEDMYRVNLPPLLIQPLVENAIRHGIGNRVEGGTVRLTAYQSEGEFRFVIEDTGVGFEIELLQQLPNAKPGQRQGVGLININKRLKYEYGTGLLMESTPGRGTKVTVRIPAEPA